MQTVIYDSSRNQLSSSSTGSSGIVYNRLDIGVLLLNQTFNANDTYDFRVPGDSNNNTFKYRFPRNGYVLGVTMTGTVSSTITGGNYVQRYNAGTGQGADVMTPSDPGNTQTYNSSTFPQTGMIIMAPAPIPYNKDDLANMKFHANGAATVSLSGFLLVGLIPQ